MGSETNLAVDFKSFPADPKQNHINSYSHGFEKIYALENVDIRSLRKIDLSTPHPLQHDLNYKNEKFDSKIEAQLHFDFKSSDLILEPFVLREPIQVLGLTKRIETFLISQNKRLIKDLLNDDRLSLIEIKGLGLGHLDELQHKLQDYLNAFHLKSVHRIDFASWMRSLVAEIDSKKAYVTLEPFQLSDIITLTSLEAIEVKRISPEKQREWSTECIELFRESSKYKQVHEDMQKIVAQFVTPWMDNRHGIATQMELSERMAAVSIDNNYAQKALDWMKMIYFDGQFPLQPFLSVIDRKLYGSNVNLQKKIVSLLKKVRSYFYNSGIYYDLSMLSELIVREYAREWVGFDEGFIEKILRLSPQFRVRKGESGELIVKLS